MTDAGHIEALEAIWQAVSPERKEHIAVVYAAIEPPRTPLQWRKIEAQYASVKARLRVLVPAAYDLDADYGGEEAEALEREASAEEMAVEAVILQTPAVDLHALKFKMDVFDLEFYGSEQVWALLKADIIRYLDAFAKMPEGVFTVFEQPRREAAAVS